MTKVIKSLAVLAVVGVVAVGATYAFFSDTETSSGNTITAGSLNLQLECPAPVENHMDALHPNTGTDTTGYSTDTLNGTELGYLASSDDNRYVSNYAWFNSYLGNNPGQGEPYEFLNFGMPNIPNGATINSASLTLEWRRGSGITASRVKLYDGSTWQIHDLSLPDANTDTVAIVDLYALGFTTKEKLDALQIQFQATQSGTYNQNDSNSKTAIDLVEVNAAYSLVGQPYWCDNGLTGTFVVSNIKPTDTGSPVATIKYKNNGSVGGTLTMKPVVVSDADNDCNSAETKAGDTTCGPTDGGELSQYLHLVVNGTDAGDLATLAAGSGIDLGALSAGADSSLTLNWELPDAADINKIQSDGTEFTLEFMLEQ